MRIEQLQGSVALGVFESTVLPWHTLNVVMCMYRRKSYTRQEHLCEINDYSVFILTSVYGKPKRNDLKVSVGQFAKLLLGQSMVITFTTRCDYREIPERYQWKET